VISKLATPRRYIYSDYLLTVRPDIYGSQLRSDCRLLERYAAVLRPGSSRGYPYQLLTGVGGTSWLWLPQLKLPVLIIMGAGDPIVPLVNGRILASRLPNARLEVVDCGHLIILTHSEKTAQAIERFLLEAPQGSAPERFPFVTGVIQIVGAFALVHLRLASIGGPVARLYDALRCFGQSSWCTPVRHRPSS
jgi:hypothetical protein